MTGKVLSFLVIFLYSVVAYSADCSDITKVDPTKLGQDSGRKVGPLIEDFMMQPRPGTALRMMLFTASDPDNIFRKNWVFGFRCVDGTARKIFERFGPINKAAKIDDDQFSLRYSCGDKSIEIYHEWDQAHGTFFASKANPPRPQADFTEPQLMETAPLDYPSIARTNHDWVGLYVATLRVSEKGTVLETLIERVDCEPIDDVFRKYLVDAMSKWKFKPAVKKNVPVSAWISLPIAMKLASH